MEFLLGLAVLLLAGILVLAVVAFVRTQQIQALESRLAAVEAALLRLVGERVPAEPEPAEVPILEPAASPQSLETLIGQRWLGWIAVLLIFLAAAFFVKHAFESRWIGELGRVAIGVAGGVAFTWAGYERYRRGWPYFSQILTGGGIALLYLSAYAAFAYYRLIGRGAAFALLVLVVIEGNVLALAYNARVLAVMSLAGGLLVPLLLRAPYDQHRALFTYLALLNLGVVSLALARQWRWLATLAFAGTHALFWAWYLDRYDPASRPAAALFQLVVFGLFLLLQLRGRADRIEEWIRGVANPWALYAALYYMLRRDYADWMGALAIALAAGYAAFACLARWRLESLAAVLLAAGTGLTFLTVAIPVQFDGNWITIGWAVEALLLSWAAIQTATEPLRRFAAAVFALAAARHLLDDTPWRIRPPFAPVWNRYFLTTAVLAACLIAAAYLYRAGSMRLVVTYALAGTGVLWLSSSLDVYSYFEAQAAQLDSTVSEQAVRQLRWAGQMSLSLVWSSYAAVLTAAGFRLRLRPLRAAGLALFGLTLLKVLFVDMAELRQFYRIIAVLALGVVLLAVAWAYQRILRREA